MDSPCGRAWTLSAGWLSIEPISNIIAELDRNMIGKTISHYRVIERLGGGGMGVVYKAEDLKLKRIVALKFLAPDLTRDLDSKKRFVNEAQAASALQHVNICTIHEIDETDEGQIFICMDYYEGENLKKIIERGPLGIGEAINISIQIARGLARAHEAKEIHRDIKPANIIVTNRGEVKIVDFGLARLVGQTRLTKESSVLGTVAYMSPEQIMGETVDYRTDIWSLGVVLYEMISGQLPFHGEYDQSVMFLIVNAEIAPLCDLRSGVPRELDLIVNKALCKNPEKRYRNVTEMLTNLERLREKTITNKTIPLSRGLNRKRSKIWGLALSLLVSLVLINIFIDIPTKLRDVFRAERKTLAILKCENRDDPEDSDRLGEMITDLLITDLAECRYIWVTTLEQYYDMLKKMGINRKDLVGKSVQIEAAKRAGVSQIIYPRIGRSDGRYVLLADCIDVKKEKVRDSIEIECDRELIHSMIDSLSKRIRQNLDLPKEAWDVQDKAVIDVTTRFPEAYRYYLIGQELAAKYDVKKAVQAFEKAVSIDSTFATAYSRLAAAYEFLDKTAQKKASIQKAFDHISHINERERFYIQFQLACDLKEFEIAKDLLLTWIDRYPKDKEAKFELGYFYAYTLRMYDEAIEQYKMALDLDNQYRAAQNYLGYAYARKGMKHEAISAIQKYVSLAPGEVNPYDSLGELYMNLMGDYERAENSFEKAIFIDPEFFPQKLAEVYQLKGQYHKADSLFQEFLDREYILQKESKYFLLARLYYEWRDYDKAQEYLRKAELYRPISGKIHWLSGLIHLKCNQRREAAKDVRQLTQSDPDSENYFHLLGQISLADASYARAIQLMQKAIEKIDYIAWSYIEHREFYHESLAEAYFQRGDFDRAIRHCLNIITDNPNWAGAYFLLGKIYEQKGQKASALKAFKDFLHVWCSADRDLYQIVYASQRIESLEETLN